MTREVPDNLGAGPLIERLLGRLCDVSALGGGLVLVAMATMTVVSVVGRAFFSHPILGDVELVQLGGAVVVASFLPYAQFQRANLIVDFFTSGARERTQHAMDALGTLFYTLVMALIVWRVAAGAVAMHESQESSMLMNLPLWWPYALMLPGLALAVVIGSHQTFGMTLHLLRGGAR
ncbi:TRAP transporter small permease [Ideonella livida]|uniref:TRAP transporter small permease protein n=1 Tax=Ideonella livida TaxID=2707176 RepID=A0A7C9TJ74_9BURK|nr:TRAP transporter small permease [Ideonella livida]NDY90405.1 TRAP transporter small permease [Ideonella livida]